LVLFLADFHNEPREVYNVAILSTSQDTCLSIIQA
jgi:hypothetical protein